MKFCFRCGLRVPVGTSKYCSKGCQEEERKVRDSNGKKYARNRAAVKAAWDKKNPGLSIYPGWPHKFNEELVCEFCRTTWHQSRDKKGVRCTNPQGHAKIRINSDGKPKIVRDVA